MPLPNSHITSNPNGKDGTIPVQLYVLIDLEQYFTKKLCLGHGWRQKILPFMLEKLAEACASSGLEPSWDPGNEEAVAIILNRLNFEAPKPKKNVSRNK